MTPDNKIAADYDALRQEMAALREDLSHIAKTVSGIAGRRGKSVASDFAEGFEEARHYVSRTGGDAEKQFESSVAAHPLLAIGLAAGAGLLVGAMSRR